MSSIDVYDSFWLEYLNGDRRRDISRRRVQQMNTGSTSLINSKTALLYAFGRRGGLHTSAKRVLDAQRKQSVLKVIKSGGTKKRYELVRQFKYITTRLDQDLNKYNIPAWGDPSGYGVESISIEQLDAIADDWELDRIPNTKSGDTIHFVMSFPSSTEPKDVEAIGKEWAEDFFSSGNYGDNWKYVAAIHDEETLHEDEDGNMRNIRNPHVHFIINRVGISGELLFISDRGHMSFDELHDKRIEISERYGIDLAHSSRLDRGIIDKVIPVISKYEAKRKGLPPVVTLTDAELEYATQKILSVAQQFKSASDTIQLLNDRFGFDNRNHEIFYKFAQAYENVAITNSNKALKELMVLAEDFKFEDFLKATALYREYMTDTIQKISGIADDVALLKTDHSVNKSLIRGVNIIKDDPETLTFARKFMTPATTQISALSVASAVGDQSKIISIKNQISKDIQFTSDLDYLTKDKRKIIAPIIKNGGFASTYAEELFYNRHNFSVMEQKIISDYAQKLSSKILLDINNDRYAKLYSQHYRGHGQVNRLLIDRHFKNEVLSTYSNDEIRAIAIDRRISNLSSNITDRFEKSVMQLEAARYGYQQGFIKKNELSKINKFVEKSVNFNTRNILSQLKKENDIKIKSSNLQDLNSNKSSDLDLGDQ